MLLHAFQRSGYTSLKIYWTIHFKLTATELTELSIASAPGSKFKAVMWLYQYRTLTGMHRRVLHCLGVINPLATSLIKAATVDDDLTAVSALVDMFMEEGEEFNRGWRSKEQLRIPASLQSLSKIMSENPFALSEIVRPPEENVVETWLDGSSRYNSFDEDSQFD